MQIARKSSKSYFAEAAKTSFVLWLAAKTSLVLQTNLRVAYGVRTPTEQQIRSLCAWQIMELQKLLFLDVAWLKIVQYLVLACHAEPCFDNHSDLRRHIQCTDGLRALGAATGSVRPALVVQLVV